MCSNINVSKIRAGGAAGDVAAGTVSSETSGHFHEYAEKRSNADIYSADGRTFSHLPFALQHQVQ